MASAGSTNGTSAGAAATGTPADAYRWFLAWGVALLVVAIINRSRLGHVIVYYVLALTLVFLFVTQAAWFGRTLAPLSDPAGQKLHTPGQSAYNGGAAVAHALTGG